jgi:pimeloyl-ACP methyl ester carboxylesterase
VWRVEEAGDGPPLLAVHGVGGGAYFFRGLAERLGLRYRVIAVDLPSEGGSAADSSAGAASIASWVEGLQELVDARIGQPVVVIGHSLGTILALESWRRWPQHIRSMVFVGGLPQVRPPIRLKLSQRIEAIASGGIDGWGPRVSPGVFAARTFVERPEVIGMFERLLEAQAPSAYIRMLQNLLGAAAADVVPSVTVPCVAISGRDDAYAPPDDVADFVARLPVACDRIVLADVGHMPFFEAPQEFAQAIQAFLETLPPPAAPKPVP